MTLDTHVTRNARRIYTLLPEPARAVARRAYGWIRKPGDLGYLLRAIGQGQALNTRHIEKTAESLERLLPTIASSDRIAIHRDIGTAIFSRSADLYRGHRLPRHLKRYTFPAFISASLNTHCNAACFFCREQDYKGQLIDFDDLKRLEAGIRHARVLEFTGWGEPFSYPRLADVVEWCNELNPSCEFSFATNASLLSREWGERLRDRLQYMTLSVNASTEGTYAAQMRYKNDRYTLSAILDNIREFRSALSDRDRSRLAFHMVANSENFREVPEFVRLAASSGISIVTIGHFMCANEAHLDKTLWHFKDEYNKSLEAGVEIGLRLGVAVHGRRFFTDEAMIKGQDSCVAPFERMYVEIPGSMTPCCFMGAARMGNVYDDGLEKVWFSDHMMALRRSRSLPACQVCTIFTPFDQEITHISSWLSLKGVRHETPTAQSLKTSRKQPRRHGRV
jgi:MoaA/NifB/PqqE/SkfB family radical SAM enzyme